MTDEAATLWLDTSVVWQATKLREIAALAKRSGVKVVIPAQVHMESYRQQRTARGDRFSADIFRGILEELRVEIAEMTLDAQTAEKWGEILHRRYPSEEAWRAAKLSCVKTRLPQEVTFQAERVPMTTDWLMALEIERREFYVAVDDAGEEWRALRATSPKRALTYDETLAWLRSRASE
jgi:hypothetical protein